MSRTPFRELTHDEAMVAIEHIAELWQGYQDLDSMFHNVSVAEWERMLNGLVTVTRVLAARPPGDDGARREGA